MAEKVIEVAAGLVFRNGRLLITQRRPGDHLEGLWEFPGGKREPGESFEACLKRELQEELGIDVQVGDLLDSVLHRYPGKTVRLNFYCCRCLAGEPQALGCQDLAWIYPAQLESYSFPPADQQLLLLLQKRLDLWK